MAVNRHCLQYTVYDDDRRVTRSLALCVCFVDRCLSFCTFSFGYCVVCSSSIYRFWLPLWYLQTLLSCSCFHRLLNYLLFTYFAFERISLMLFQKLIALNLISKFSLIKPEHPETTIDIPWLYYFRKLTEHWNVTRRWDLYFHTAKWLLCVYEHL